MIAVRAVMTVKPAAKAVRTSATGNATARRRAKYVSAANNKNAASDAIHEGSRSAVK